MTTDQKWQSPEDSFALELARSLLDSIKSRQFDIDEHLTACCQAAEGAFTWRCQVKPDGMEAIIRRINYTYGLLKTIAPQHKFPIHQALVRSICRATESVRYGGWKERGLRTAYSWSAVALSDLCVVLRWCLQACEKFDDPKAFLSDPEPETKWLLAVFRISLRRKS
jgi:hypothetical protein